MAVRAEEERMGKLVDEEEMAGMQLGIGMERMVRMVLGAESKFHVLELHARV
jgi:hypothetical protein